MQGAKERRKGVNESGAEKTDSAGLTGQAGVEFLIHIKYWHETLTLSRNN